MKSHRELPRATSAPRTSERSEGANRLRIIGGRWRGTRLIFPDVAELRPTSDRVRETLFNWLQQGIVGARCLDLFAGSGALGLEALSRGAAWTTFVDQQPQVARYLSATLDRLQCTAAEVHNRDAYNYLQNSDANFDLVFLDPPFAAAASGSLLTNLFALLETPGRLNPQAWIYLECPASMGAPTALSGWPTHWQLQRSKQAGQVGYHLARRTSMTTPGRHQHDNQSALPRHV